MASCLGLSPSTRTTCTASRRWGADLLCWIVIRDMMLFLLGAALIVRELLSRAPDPFLIETGATMTGIPAWLHTRNLAHTESTHASTPELPHSDSQSSGSMNSSESES